MYQCKGDEVLVTQHIGDGLMAQWKDIERQGHTLKRLQFEWMGQMAQEGNLERIVDMMKAGTPQGEDMVGITADIARKAMLGAGAGLKAKWIEFERAARKMDAAKSLFWLAVEAVYTPNEDINLGVREHHEAGKEQLALVKHGEGNNVQEGKDEEALLQKFFKRIGKG